MNRVLSTAGRYVQKDDEPADQAQAEYEKAQQQKIKSNFKKDKRIIEIKSACVQNDIKFLTGDDRIDETDDVSSQDDEEPATHYTWRKSNASFDIDDI